MFSYLLSCSLFFFFLLVIFLFFFPHCLILILPRPLLLPSPLPPLLPLCLHPLDYRPFLFLCAVCSPLVVLLILVIDPSPGLHLFAVRLALSSNDRTFAG